MGGVGLADPASFLTVGTIHLHHHDLLVVKESGQAGTPRSGALHPNLFHFTEPDQPAEELLVAGPGLRETSLCLTIHRCDRVLLCQHECQHHP